ncbi:uncharacterized protein LOC110467014 [Mizuhopecten yessoensis]|uniref:Zinc finger FYVE domain-containing protein 21 n=1 Tax=Mizuhopecten yessoensis TaxID=6573 RepID=A0A210PMU2_MIZYE|nr:uncharacterized protein LOC110467014 [Mizuhopecten yessoensis]OWF37808.1 Zinc finger FYVE domain-containing protein 21 [Mizuhopecten yessoensis]
MMGTYPRVIKLEGVDVFPARTEGLLDVSNSPNFILVKPSWVADDAVSFCVLCNNKFNQLRRKHHCRQCGRVLCGKCCNEKVLLPQLGICQPERVCDSCLPVAHLVTKSRSSTQQHQIEGAQGLVKQLIEPHGLCRVVELGGLQTLVALGRINNEVLAKYVMSGLHQLSMHHPLHRILVEIGVVCSISSIMMRPSCMDEQVKLDGIGALMIFCKSSELRAKVVKDGVLDPVLKLCAPGNSYTVAVLAVSTLSLVAENQDTNARIIESEHKVLFNILCLTASSDEQMQEVSLKVLVSLSLGSTFHMHRIIQEDFTCGRSLVKVMKSKPQNDQVLVNCACLVSNLATSAEDQGGLQELMECLCEVLRLDIKSKELVIQLARGIANFAKFEQNADRLMKYLPLIVFKCLKSGHHASKTHGIRATLHLLSHRPNTVTEELAKNGAEELLDGIAKLPGLTKAIDASLLVDTPEKSSCTLTSSSTGVRY